MLIETFFGDLKMAKQRKQHSIMDAIESVTKALAIESIPNPTEEQKQQIHEAKQQAAAVVNNSNFAHLADNADEAIEQQIQAEEQAEIEAAQAEQEAIEAENQIEPPQINN